MIRQQPDAAKVNIDMDSTGSAGALSSSRRGESIARASRDALEAAGKRSFKAQRQILEDGFQAIVRDRESTLDEKIIATMALQMQKKIPDHKPAVSASSVMMDALASSLACTPYASVNTLGNAVAHLTHEAFINSGRSLCRTDYGPAIVQTGMDVLEMNVTSKKEKALASLGQTMLKNGHTYEAYQVMSVLSQPLTLPCAAHIANAMIYTAGSGFTDHKDTQDALLRAFSAIAQSPLSSTAEKEVAQFGSRVLNECGPARETLACAGSLMSGLSDPLKDSPAAVTAKAALKAYPDLMIFLYETPELKNIVSCAFSAIGESPSASEDDKRIAALGASVMEKTAAKSAALAFSNHLLIALAYPPEKPRNHHVIIGAELGAASTNDLQEKKDLYTAAFKTIIADPSLDREKKAMAEDAVRVGETFGDEKLAVDTMLDLAEQFIGRRKKNNLKEIEILMGGAGKDSLQPYKGVEIHDDILDIDGIRLKRKSTGITHLQVKAGRPPHK